MERMVIGLMIGLASINRRATDNGTPLSVSALNNGIEIKFPPESSLMRIGLVLW